MFDSSKCRVGDSVIVHNYRDKSRVITQVTKITPSGRIQTKRTEHNEYFDKQGVGKGWIYHLNLEYLPFATTTEETLKEDLILRMKCRPLSIPLLLLINGLLVDNEVQPC